MPIFLLKYLQQSIGIFLYIEDPSSERQNTFITKHVIFKTGPSEVGLLTVEFLVLH